jgi:hypothetical protein
MSLRTTRYLKVPRAKLHELPDLFTRIDEELTEVIYGLDMVIQLLERLVGPAVPRVEVQVPPLPTPTITVPPRVEKVVAIPSKAVLTATLQIQAVEGEWREVKLVGDVVLLTADSDIYVSNRPEVGFLLTAGAYMSFYRSEAFPSIYIKSSVGTANVYLAFFEVEE